MFLKSNNDWLAQNTIAYFPIILNTIHSGVYVLEANNIKYNSFDPQIINHSYLWQNTQMLIYHTLNYRASLMSLLFGSLQIKRSLHFITDQNNDINDISIDVEINKFEDICICITYPNNYVYNDENITYAESPCNHRDNLLQLINVGYEFAERNNVTSQLINKINQISLRVLQKLHSQIPNEDKEKLLTLCKTAVAYTYPTTRFKNKSFSTILSKYTDENQHCEYSNGGIFLLWKYRGDNNIKKLIHIISQDSDFFRVRINATQYCLNITTSILLKRIQSESIKSAVSAIMTRNMSHNLGSHYLYYTKTHLDNLARRGGNIGPDIRGAARVMEYMQGRMDYLATIVSMDRYPYGCVNFKSQIYDVLTIDNFSKRHFKSSGNNVSRTVRHNVDVLLEEMRSVGKIDRSHLERMHKLTQDALDDNKNKRTTNFLLTNLILSEGFTRSDITIDDVQNDVKTINIHVRYNDQLFTGQADKEEEESGIKEQLTKLNIAMPGGVMSCHAFFNIIENFIRNSAKYLQADFKEEGLTVTIKIEEKEGVKDRYYFTIYDNKQNANKPLEDIPGTTLIESIKNRLGSLQILDDNNAVEKSNKGFKEMLFSAIWMQSYIYSNKQGQGNLGSYADVLNAIHSATTGDEKLDLITEYAFSIVAVDDNGNECGTDTKGNLGLRFALPKFQNYIDLNISGDYNSINTDINSLLNVYGDIAYVDKVKLESFIGNLKKRDDKININPLLVIPRMINDKPENDIDALKQVLYKRFGEEEFNKYKLHFASGEDEKYNQADDKYRIYFQQHLSSKGDMSSFRYYAYADSVSGGNFTLTLSEIASRWDGNDNYEILKIKESALTRITFIDERLFDKMERQGIATELSCKNIRVLNYKEPELQADELIDFMKMFTGNEFNRGGNATHFLSIHLGLVEKIIQDSTFFNSMTDEKGEKYSSQDSETRTTAFMRLLKEYFGPEVFISIHSGRGNFSAELEGPLSVYPFISMAAIENTFDNSKYLLCQLFYSTIYLGKGVANKES